jgi:predicted ATPase
MITSISAKNFKSWKDTGKIRLAPITGLFGSNSSGKTSLLQLLLMLKQTAESSDRAQVLNLGDDRSLVELGTFKDIVLDHKSEAGMTWMLAWNLKDKLKIVDPEHRNRILFEGDRLQFQAVIEENGTGRMVVKELLYDFAEHRFGMRQKQEKSKYALFPSGNEADFRFLRIKGRPWELPAPVKCYGFPDQVKAYYQNAGFLADFQLAFEELFTGVYYLGPLRDYPKRQYTWAGAQPGDMGRKGEKVVDALLASRERKEFISRGHGRKRFTVEEYVAWWLRELKLIHSFKVEPIKEGGNLYQVKVRKTQGSAEVLITDVGFGVSQILPVLTICYYVPEGSTILMEQPEIHLHPSVQAGLADVLIDAAQKRGVQIILESHSEYLLKRLQLRIAEQTSLSRDAALYFCDIRDGVSELTPLVLNLFGDIENWPEGFFGDEFEEMAARTKARMQRELRGEKGAS